LGASGPPAMPARLMLLGSLDRILVRREGSEAFEAKP
jgi:hypothetical protein